MYNLKYNTFNKIIKYPNKPEELAVVSPGI